MSEDIVKRLRAWGPSSRVLARDMLDAIAEIERLRAEVLARDAIAARIQSLFDREDEARNEALRLLSLVAHSPSTDDGFLVGVELWDEICAFVQRMRGE